MYNQPSMSSVGTAYCRRLFKMERIARLELEGYNDTEIGMCLGIHKVYVSRLRRTPEFIQVRTQVASGVLLNMDSDTDEAIKTSMEELRQTVPNAVLILKNTMLNSKLHPRIRMDAAKEILDREGTLAKVSKSEIKETKRFSFDINDGVTGDLLQALASNSGKEKIEGSADFTDTAEQSAEIQTQISKSLEEVEPATNTVQ